MRGNRSECHGKPDVESKRAEIHAQNEENQHKEWNIRAVQERPMVQTRGLLYWAKTLYFQLTSKDQRMCMHSPSIAKSVPPQNDPHQLEPQRRTRRPPANVARLWTADC